MPSQNCINFIIETASKLKYMYASQLDGFTDYVMRYHHTENRDDVKHFIETYVFDEESVYDIEYDNEVYAYES